MIQNLDGTEPLMSNMENLPNEPHNVLAINFNDCGKAGWTPEEPTTPRQMFLELFPGQSQKERRRNVIKSVTKAIHVTQSFCGPSTDRVQAGQTGGSKRNQQEQQHSYWYILTGIHFSD